MADEQQVCPSCGSFNRAGARFCSKCGHDFKPSAVTGAPATPAPAASPVSPAVSAPPAGAILCPHCGKDVGVDTRFCRHCGRPLSAAQPAATPPQVAATPAPASRAKPAPAVSVATSDDDMTQPLSVKSPPPQMAASGSATSPASADRGAPTWLWALVGLLTGILLGAGIVLATPGFFGLERVAAAVVTPAAPATDAMTPGSPAVTAAAPALDLPTATADVAATVTSEQTPAATATAAPAPETSPAPVAPPDEAETPSTTATDSTTAAPPDETEALPVDAPNAAPEADAPPSGNAAAETSPTSTPLTP